MTQAHNLEWLFRLERDDCSVVALFHTRHNRRLSRPPYEFPFNPEEPIERVKLAGVRCRLPQIVDVAVSR